MQITGRITKVGETRRGTSERGNWTMTDITVAWTEGGDTTMPRDCSLIFSTSQEADFTKLQRYVASGEEVQVYVFPAVREYNGRDYNNVRGYVPQGLFV